MTSPFDTLAKSKLTHKPVLHFVHANGFPAKVYMPLFELWEAVFSVEVIELFGTDERYHIDRHWQGLTQQVLESIEQACYKHGVDKLVAVGHSVGALTTLQAITQDPTHISQSVLLDPALLMGKNSLSYFIAELLNEPLTHFNKPPYFLIDKLSPAGKSKFRKDSFTSLEAVADNLRHKALFQAFDPRCFDLYLQYGFTPTADSTFTLAIPKRQEIAIFRTMPSLYWLKSPTLYRPSTIIAGKDSYFMHIGSYQKAHQRWGIPLLIADGTHMFPLEHPEATANLVLETIYQQIIAKS